MDAVHGLDLDQPPFDLLDDAGRARLAARVDMGYHPRGQVIIAAGAPSEHVVVLMKGQVHAFDLDGAGHEQRFADYGPGDIFGAWAVMAGRARHSYRADTDVVSFLIPAGLFRTLLSEQPAFAAWFQEGLAVKGQLADRARGSELAELMVTQVGAAQLAPAVRVPAAMSIADASERLREERVDCLLVDDPAHPQPGVVTRTDLLEALTRTRLPLESPVGPLASRPLVAQQTTDVLFQALVTMAERHIERIAVRDGDAIVGTLGMAEVLSHYASHSHLITLRLARAQPGRSGRHRARHDSAGVQPARAGCADAGADGTGQRAHQPGDGAVVRTAGATRTAGSDVPAGAGQRGPPRAVAEDRPGQCIGGR
jgi:CBS domain-containing protein